MQTTDSLGKSLMLGKTEHKRGRVHQRTRQLDGITKAMEVNLGKLREMVRDREPGVLQSVRSQRVGYDWATKQRQHSLQTHEAKMDRPRAVTDKPQPRLEMLNSAQRLSEHPLNQ